MWMKPTSDYRKPVRIIIYLGTFCIAVTVLVHRGLHGEYSLGVDGLTIVFLGFIPFLVVFIIRSYYRRLSYVISYTVAILLAISLVFHYLSSNGLWCAQHPSVTRELCAKLAQFASFAASSNLTSWWLIFGDLLAIQRGLDMPLRWEHDIDVCIVHEEFPVFEKAVRSSIGYFYPEPELYERGHWYIPIDMAKLGLRSREAEGVNVDIWTCPSLSGNITQVFYCNGLVNVPGSLEERHQLLTKYYKDYSVVKYSHHKFMCRIWNG